MTNTTEYGHPLSTKQLRLKVTLLTQKKAYVIHLLQMQLLDGIKIKTKETPRSSRPKKRRVEGILHYWIRTGQD